MPVMFFLTLNQIKMNRRFLTAIIIVSLFLQKSFAQDSAKQIQPRLSQLLTSYYHIKDALVAGNANSASASAGQFVKTANGIDYKVISEGNINALLKDAGDISETRDIIRQRELFANFSANMLGVAKAVKL